MSTTNEDILFYDKVIDKKGRAHYKEALSIYQDIEKDFNEYRKKYNNYDIALLLFKAYIYAKYQRRFYNYNRKVGKSVDKSIKNNIYNEIDLKPKDKNKGNGNRLTLNIIDRNANLQARKSIDALLSQLSTVGQKMSIASIKGEDFNEDELVNNELKQKNNSRAKTLALLLAGLFVSGIRSARINATNARLVKTWNGILDARIRKSHEVAHYQYRNNPIPINEPFIVGGEALQFPRDPAGSLKNIINCRCQVEYKQIS